MLKVGITGGIGSGKSIVCQVFATLGIPVFKADDAARYLMEHDTALVAAIKELLGSDVYVGSTLQRDNVSALVYNNEGLRQQLNALVHPATIAYSEQWMQSRSAPYVLKEAAIFFESGSHTSINLMIGVYAPEEVRINRAMQRGGLKEELVRSIIASQMDEQQKMDRCNYVITNDDVQAVLPQVLAIHTKLLSVV